MKNIESYKSQYEGYLYLVPKAHESFYSIGMVSASKQEFEFTKIGLITKFFLSAGLSKKFLVDEQDFDQNIYIYSDSNAFCQDLYRSKELQGYIKELINLGVESIVSKNARLYITFKKNPENFTHEDYVDHTTVILGKINEILKNFPSSQESSDYVQHKLLKYRKKSSYFAMLTVMMYFVFRILGDENIDQLLYYQQLLNDSIYFSVVLFIVILAITTKFFLKTSIFHLVIGFQIGLLPLLIMDIYTSLFCINVYFDNSSEEIIYTSVIEKKTEYHLRRPDTYIAIVTNVKEPEIYNLKVSHQLYKAINFGSIIRVTVKGGYLGYKWVEKEENIVEGVKDNMQNQKRSPL